MKIHVTEKDIKNGKMGSETSCPITLAIKRRFKRKDISANCISIRIGNVSFIVPWKVCEFISRFDHGKKVRPISFFLRELK